MSDIMREALGPGAGGGYAPTGRAIPADPGVPGGTFDPGGPAATPSGGGLGSVLAKVAGAGALSVLAGLAVKALAGGGASSGGSASAAQPGLREAAVPAVDPETLSMLCLRSMVAATKADGQVDDAEIQAVLQRMGQVAQDPQARAFLQAEFRKPLDLAEIVGPVRDPHTAAQVYAASLFAMRPDTRAEQAYLQKLAQALRLPPEAVARLHQMVGVG
jgi:uncharacterized membrane protein YebE (DUF533 family)